MRTVAGTVSRSAPVARTRTKSTGHPVSASPTARFSMTRSAPPPSSVGMKSATRGLDIQCGCPEADSASDDGGAVQVAGGLTRDDLIENPSIRLFQSVAQRDLGCPTEALQDLSVVAVATVDSTRCAQVVTAFQ